MDFIWVLIYWCMIIHISQSAYYCPADLTSYGRLCSHYNDKCQTNQDCIIPGHGCCYVPTCGKECFNLARPRVCPTPPPFDSDFCSTVKLAPGCSTDDDCVGEDKICCPAGKCHVKDCVYPPRYGRPNPGVCPVPRALTPLQCSRLTIVTDCIRDTDCRDGKKCCETGCDVLKCLTPMINRPECPSVKCTQYTDLCKSDKDCKYGEVCCYGENSDAYCKKCVKRDTTNGHSRRKRSSAPVPMCLTCCGPPPCCGPCISCGAGQNSSHMFCNVNESTCPEGEYCKTLHPGSHGICCAGFVIRRKRQILPNTKAGYCPPPRVDCGMAFHPDECNTDYSCPGKQKCCSNGCFKDCTNPKFKQV